MLSTGIGWTKLPRELGYGSGWTCWRRMREWSEAGVCDQLHPGRPRPARAARRAGLVAGQPGLGQRPGEKGGDLIGANPTDRGKCGSKYHLLVDATGLPLNVAVSVTSR